MPEKTLPLGRSAPNKKAEPVQEELQFVKAVARGLMDVREGDAVSVEEALNTLLSRAPLGYDKN
jgi:hypothetical protein